MGCYASCSTRVFYPRQLFVLRLGAENGIKESVLEDQHIWSDNTYARESSICMNGVDSLKQSDGTDVSTKYSESSQGMFSQATTSNQSHLQTNFSCSPAGNCSNAAIGSLDVCPRDMKAIVSNELKRVVFVGGTGAGKSSLCTVLTGHEKQDTPFAIGDRYASKTVECTTGTHHWFGDPYEEEFICIDTPGLNDELGRDDAHVNIIIDNLCAMEYVNAIVFVLNGQENRFSNVLQKMIKRFEEAFSERFYDHSIICITRWYMDGASVQERELDGRTEENVTKELIEKICGCENLKCCREIPVVFVDSQYRFRDPDFGKQRLKKIQDSVGNTVFRTADLEKVKPKITELTNSKQEISKGIEISVMSPMLLDKEVRIVRWYCEPELPDGLIYCESKGMITGTPIVMFPKRDFQLFAQSVSCVSDGYKFSIEVAPSEEDVGLIVLKSIGTISSQVDAILQIDKNDSYFDDADINFVIDEAKKKGSQLLEEEYRLIKDKYGFFRNYPRIVEVLQAKYNSEILTSVNNFLSVNQKTVSHRLEQDQVGNKIQVALLEHTENYSNLKWAIDKAKALSCDEALIQRADEWLNQITRSSCCNAAKGCKYSVMKKDLPKHETICMYGLPLLSKKSVVRGVGPRTDDVLDNIALVCNETTDETLAVTYKYSNGVYVRFNQTLSRYQTVRPLEAEKAVEPRFLSSKHEHWLSRNTKSRIARAYCDVCGSSPTIYGCGPCNFDLCKNCFDADAERKETPADDQVWVITVRDGESESDAENEVMRSTSAVSHVLDAVFKDPSSSSNLALTVVEDKYSWAPISEPISLNSDSVKLIYFGGKWCPYCPPFTAKLAKFYSSVVKQKSSQALEVIFISSDVNEEAMFDYYMNEHGDWPALPFAEREIKSTLSDAMDVSGIPSCYVLDTITSEPKELDVRKLLGTLCQEPGARQDQDALNILLEMEKAAHVHLIALAKKQLTGVKSEWDGVPVDIFCSLRFGEAMEQAKKVQTLLRAEHGINAFIVDTAIGNNIFDEIVSKLVEAKMVIIFGTVTYGRGTSSNFCTKEELQFISDEKKDFFLIKMCKVFEEPRTRMILNGSVMYKEWLPNTDMPPDLIENIVEKFNTIR